MARVQRKELHTKMLQTNKGMNAEVAAEIHNTASSSGPLDGQPKTTSYTKHTCFSSPLKP